MPARNVVKTRKLTDLYRRGREIVLGEDTGEPVTVWIQKLNPVESENAARKANAVRATKLLERKDKESEAYIAAMSDLVDMTHEELFSFAVNDELGNQAISIEAEYAGSEEWAKEDYLQSLYDAWENGLRELYHSHDEGEEPDPEAKRVYDELERYEGKVQELILAARAEIEEQFENKSDEELTEMLLQRLLKTQADIAWLVEYRKSEVWQGTRFIEDHSQRYFEKRSEVDELDPKVLTPLVNAFQELNVDVIEGKDSPPMEDSSSASA